MLMINFCALLSATWGLHRLTLVDHSAVNYFFLFFPINYFFKKYFIHHKEEMALSILFNPGRKQCPNAYDLPRIVLHIEDTDMNMTYSWS